MHNNIKKIIVTTMLTGVLSSSSASVFAVDGIKMEQTPPVYIDEQVKKDMIVSNMPSTDSAIDNKENVIAMNEFKAPPMSEQKSINETNKIQGKGKAINNSSVKAAVDKMKVEVVNAKNNASDAKGFVTEFTKKVETTINNSLPKDSQVKSKVESIINKKDSITTKVQTIIQNKK